MTRILKPATRIETKLVETRVEVEDTVLAQILRISVNSVVRITDDGISTILHRTGVDGWLLTRPFKNPNSTIQENRYVKNDEIEDVLRAYSKRCDEPLVEVLAEGWGNC